MMIKKKSNPWARLKYLYILPLAAASVAAFARPEVSNSLDEISSAKVSDLASIMKADGEKSVENLLEEKVKVAGKVVEEKNGLPVLGASIVIRGTVIGTLTDVDGNFSIVANEGDVLLFSFVGMQAQSVIVPKGGAKSMVVSMKDDVQNLDEVMVVGYAAYEDEVVEAKSIKLPKEEKKENEEQVIFQVVEEMPNFPGGMNECMKFLARNIKYPVLAQEAKIEGRVIVQFVVDRDGSVNDIKVVRSISPQLDAEAVRVIGLMPKWNPGKQRGKAVAVKYTMPIQFRLDKPKAEEKVVHAITMKVDKEASQETVDAVKYHLRGKVPRVNYEADENGPVVQLGVRGSKAGQGTDSVLIVVDDVIQGHGQKVMNSIHPQNIDRIEVLKEKSAILAYGDKAKHGVIIITTKKNK